MSLCLRLALTPRLLLALAVLVFSPALALAQRDTAGMAPDGVRAVVLGVVYDSVSRVPLVGATVQLVTYPELGTESYTTVADSTGAYFIEGVPRGRYLAGFFHPALDSLRLQAPLRLIEVVEDGPLRVDLGIPSPARILAELCPGVAPGDSTGLLLGRVRDADTDAPLGSGTVVLTWTDLQIGDRGLEYQRRRVPTHTTDDGWYMFCGVPTDTELLARAEHGADSSGFIEVRVPPRGLLKQDFLIGTAELVAIAPDSDGVSPRTVHRGPARLTGRVRSPTGSPLAGARLLLWGSGVEVEANDRGEFAMADLPTGTHSLEARQIGYAPRTVAVNLSGRTPASVDIVLERAEVLEPVHVFGKASPRRSLSGFLERRERGGFGRFLTREEIERVRAFRTSDVFRHMPGVSVVPTGSFGSAITMRGGCTPVVYVDGMKLMGGHEELDRVLQPSDIAGVEVYTGLAGAPPQFDGNGCGTVVIWTGAQAR